MRSKKNVTPEDFVLTWQTSQTLDEVCTKLSMTKANAMQRYKEYKSKGIPLNEKPKGKPGRKLDIEKLKLLAQEIVNKTHP